MLIGLMNTTKKFGKRMKRTIPVSYTHLDVYKRQLATRTSLGLVPVQEGKVRAETGVINNATPYWLVGQPPVPPRPCTESCPPYEL